MLPSIPAAERVLQISPEQFREMDLCQKENEGLDLDDVDVREVLCTHHIGITPDGNLVYRDSVVLRLFTGIPAAELLEAED